MVCQSFLHDHGFPQSFRTSTGKQEVTDWHEKRLEKGGDPAQGWKSIVCTLLDEEQGPESDFR